MTDRVEVWVAHLDQPRWRVERLAASLSPEERGRAERLADPRRRRRQLAARGILRAILARQVDVDPGCLELGSSAWGKPELLTPVGSPPLEFSCAHSGGIALYALTQGRMVGVDVEALRPVADPVGIARRLLSSAACRELEVLPETCRSAAFLAWWARSEAYLKARGVGWRGSGRIVLRPSAVAPAPARAADGEPADGPWSLQDLGPLPGHAAALAGHGEGWGVAWRRWEG
jgi:4'-phosphopantetheinyl transferase